ncbi:putative transcription factor C2H2 family [Helianthus annuus]|nr:putative transcription factor C2H2 family [Helianthus annuus]KAJ0654660.1 putative transcription factor C2H2 family [Helianthus annuus]KAJ0838528.1 putative transcription factor C2H2 family [Helianthus annuus]
MGSPTQKPQQDDHGEEVKQEEEEETFTCEICIEPVTLRDKFKINNKCPDHPFCTDCMIKYIQVKLEDNKSDIRCPATSCSHSLDPFSCRPTITHQLFDKWGDVLCESAVLGVERVYCPNRECSELILNECGTRKLKRCVCPDCKKPFCFRCRVPWHAGSTCRETRDENDVAFDVICEKNKWKRCPSCRCRVEHVGGCNLIMCKCGTQFCYKCGKRWCRHGLNRRLEVYGCVFMVLAFVIIIIIGTKEGAFHRQHHAAPPL